MKAIVLGFDGATLDLVRRGVERGELPAFARMLREGAWGSLRSTVPADSPSAWSSFATGVHPGCHGVFGFMARRPGDYGYRIGSSAVVSAPTLWELAGRAGARVGVINVPFTYPPHRVNGFLVAGMMTPDLASAFTHPPELREALLEAVPDYAIAHGLGRMQGVDPQAALVARSASTLAAREKAMWWLVETYNPDLLVCVFTALDRLQHFFWAAMDETHPDHDTAGPQAHREAISQAYRRLDGVLARALERADDALVVVLSDHGFEGVARTFYVNAWLAARGLLALSGERAEPSDRARRAARWARRRLRGLPGTDRWRERLRARRLVSDAFVRAIDWEHTCAWFGLERGLWLNVRGRDPRGTVAPGDEYEQLRTQLIEELESIERWETGHRVVQKVHRREDIYEGPAVSHAPDLVIEPGRDRESTDGRFILSERLGPIGAADGVPRSGAYVGPSAPISGGHTPDGLVLLRGPGISAGKQLSGAAIVDVAPTVLQWLGVSGNDSMDGSSLIAAGLQHDKTSAKDTAVCQAPSVSAESTAMTEREQEQVEERLRQLGYLD